MKRARRIPPAKRGNPTFVFVLSSFPEDVCTQLKTVQAVPPGTRLYTGEMGKLAGAFIFKS